MAEALDVVILAGGAGERLGGVSKADLLLGGRRLLDHILDDLAAGRAGVPLGRVVVVAPDSVAVPAGVSRTLEDPPGGGPAAGICAGLELLGDGALVAVLTCDAPRSARALPALLVAVAGASGGSGGSGGGAGVDGAVVRNAAGVDGAVVRNAAGVDGAVVRNAAGYDQYLLGIYRFAALRRRAREEHGARDVSARHFFAPLHLVTVDAGDLDRDVDTWADLATLEETSPGARPGAATEGA